MQPYFQILSLLFFFKACALPSDSTEFMTEEKIAENLSVDVDQDIFKICFIGDTGYGAERLTDHANTLNSQDCDEIHNLGDLIYEEGLENDRDEKYGTYFYYPFLPIFNAGTPFYLTFGNHDYKGDATVWFKKVERVPSLEMPSSYYKIEYSFGLCIINLDTNVHFIEQIRWMKFLQNDKIYNRRCRKVIFKGHHPYISSGRHGDSKDQVKTFIEQIIKSERSIYISGHDHILSYEGRFGKSHQFVTGSFVKQQPQDLGTEATYASKSYGFIKVTFTTDWTTAPLVELFDIEDPTNPLYSIYIKL